MNFRFQPSEIVERQLEEDKKRYTVLDRQRSHLEDQLDLVKAELKLLNVRARLARKEIEGRMER